MPWIRRASEARRSTSRLRVAAPWFLAGVLLVVLGQRLAVTWPEVVSAGLRFSLGWLLASVVLLGSYLLMRALLWHRLTVVVGAGIRWDRAVSAWFYSQVGKYIPGKVFLYLGRLFLYVREGRSGAAVSFAFALEWLLSILAASILGLLGAVGRRVPGIPSFGLWLLGGSLVLVVVSLHPVLLERAAARVSRILGVAPFGKPPAWRTLVGLTVLYILSWGICGLGFFSFLRSFYPVEATEIVFIAGSFSSAALIGTLVVFVPAGLGVREGVLAMLLSQILPEPAAVAGALLARGWFLVGELAGLGACYFVSWRKIGLMEEESVPVDAEAGAWGCPHSSR